MTRATASESQAISRAVRKTEVFAGQSLLQRPPTYSVAQPRCRLTGSDVDNAKVSFELDDNLFSRHLLFIGGIGTGKTNAISQIISQIKPHMTSNDVMFIFDTKGDFYEQFYKPGDVVISNDDKAIGTNGPDYWNIYQELTKGRTLETDVIEVARTLFYEKTQRTNQPFFPNAARDLFTAILLNFRRSTDCSKQNNAYLRKFIDSSTPAALREMLQEHEDLRAIASYISEDRSPQTQGVFSELQQTLREIFVENFARAGTLSVRDVIRQKGGKTIFVEYDLGIGNALTPIYRLLFDLAIKESVRRNRSEGNVWFVIDEFRLVPNLQHIDDGVNYGRSLGAKFIIGVQNVEYLYHIYGEQLARSILSGFMTCVSFSVNDEATRKFVQGRYGKNRKMESFSSSVSNKPVHEQLREGNVVEDWDIANLPTGRAIVGIPNREPFLFQFDPYRPKQP